MQIFILGQLAFLSISDEITFFATGFGDSYFKMFNLNTISVRSLVLVAFNLANDAL